MHIGVLQRPKCQTVAQVRDWEYLTQFHNFNILFFLYLLQVHLKSHFIMNGVCVRWKGWLDLERLDGVGCLEYDEDTAQVNYKDSIVINKQ